MRVEDVRRGFCRSSGGTTSALHRCGLGAVSGARLTLEIESQEEDDRRLIDVKESIEDCDDRPDHIDADEAAVDCEVDRTEAWGTGCQVVGLEGDALLIAPRILKGRMYDTRIYRRLREACGSRMKYGASIESYWRYNECLQSSPLSSANGPKS